MFAEQVAERGSVGAVRVAALQRLIELLRIAEQHQILRGLGHRQRIRKRHLAGLVHEQHVHRGGVLRSRPEPRRAGTYLRFTLLERLKHIAIFVRLLHRPSLLAAFLVQGRHPLHATQRQAFALRRSHRGADQVADHAVAVGGDADRLAGPNQRADHPCACVGLAGAWWALDRQRAVIEVLNQTDRGVSRRFGGLLQRSAFRVAARWFAKQQNRGRRDAIPPRRFHVGQPNRPSATGIPPTPRNQPAYSRRRPRRAARRLLRVVS